MYVSFPASNELSFPLQNVAAVLARKRLEDEQKAMKLQQIEEDRRMAEELL